MLCNAGSQLPESQTIAEGKTGSLAQLVASEGEVPGNPFKKGNRLLLYVQCIFKLKKRYSSYSGKCLINMYLGKLPLEPLVRLSSVPPGNTDQQHSLPSAHVSVVQSREEDLPNSTEIVL